MKTWAIGGLLGVVALGAYFTCEKRETPAAVAAPTAAATSTTSITPTTTPQVLDEVVNVTNIDSLLDPPTIPVADGDAPLAPVLVNVSADHIPTVRPVAPAMLPAARD